MLSDLVGRLSRPSPFPPRRFPLWRRHPPTPAPLSGMAISVATDPLGGTPSTGHASVASAVTRGASPSWEQDDAHT